LRDGLITEDVVIGAFDPMLRNLEGREAYFENDKRELVRLVGNAWNNIIVLTKEVVQISLWQQIISKKLKLIQ
jgi:hypothetical protein